MACSEEKVVRLFYREKVSAVDFVQEKLGVSRITVLRSLKKHGYFSSCNFNSRYFTLKDIPRFDSKGLWLYDSICFSRHGTLSKTIKTLIESSSDGHTIMELETLLKSRLHNHISSLIRRGEVSRFYCGRNAVYVSSSDRRGERQTELRRRNIEKAAAVAQTGKMRLPKGFNPVNVISVLIELIKNPGSGAVEISERLGDKKVMLTAKQVEKIIIFYSLQKKTGH